MSCGPHGEDGVLEDPPFRSNGASSRAGGLPLPGASDPPRSRSAAPRKRVLRVAPVLADPVGSLEVGECEGRGSSSALSRRRLEGSQALRRPAPHLLEVLDELRAQTPRFPGWQESRSLDRPSCSRGAIRQVSLSLSSSRTDRPPEGVGRRLQEPRRRRMRARRGHSPTGPGRRGPASRTPSGRCSPRDSSHAPTQAHGPPRAAYPAQQLGAVRLLAPAGRCV